MSRGQGRGEKYVSPCRRGSQAACFDLDTGLREGKEKESPLRVCNHKLVLAGFSVWIHATCVAQTNSTGKFKVVAAWSYPLVNWQKQTLCLPRGTESHANHIESPKKRSSSQWKIIINSTRRKREPAGTRDDRNTPLEPLDLKWSYADWNKFKQLLLCL